MAGKTVDTEALGQAASALATYIEDVKNNVHKMNDAAQDCSDNMGNDVYSMKAINNLQTCAINLNKAILAAEELRKRILDTKRKIEESV